MNRVFQHEMLREIYEQPQALRRVLRAAGAHGSAARTSLLQGLAPALQDGGGRLLMLASGSSRHAALVGQRLFEDHADLAVDVEYASEYAYRTSPRTDVSLALALSQSGETADTLAALQLARECGARTLVLTNNPDSTMARSADFALDLHAGPERAIPATKSFTCQLLVLALLALEAARARGRMAAAEQAGYEQALHELPGQLEDALPGWEQSVSQMTSRLASTESYIYLGRDLHFPIALEGALKLKESAYVHAGAYPGGEFKHGPSALLEPAVTLVALVTSNPESKDSMRRHQRMLQLLRDLRPSNSHVLAVATKGDTLATEVADEVLFLPPCPEALMPILEVVPLQLVAYNVAATRGVEIDQPRHLQKAVLAE